MWGQEAGEGGRQEGLGLGSHRIFMVQILNPALKLGLTEARDLMIPSGALLPSQLSKATSSSKASLSLLM